VPPQPDPQLEARPARRGDLEQRLAPGPDVADGRIRLGRPADGQVLPDEARRQLPPELALEGGVVLSGERIHGLIRAAVDLPALRRRPRVGLRVALQIHAGEVKR
jgi:hypothetical protein